MAETDLKDAHVPSERRGSDRKKLIVNVRFDGGDGTGIANTRDIGIGGLYMTTAAPIAVGVPILITFDLAERTLQLSGTVVYSDPGHGVGVRFRDLTEEDRNFLDHELALS